MILMFGGASALADAPRLLRSFSYLNPKCPGRSLKEMWRFTECSPEVLAWGLRDRRRDVTDLDRALHRVPRDAPGRVTAQGLLHERVLQWAVGERRVDTLRRRVAGGGWGTTRKGGRGGGHRRGDPGNGQRDRGSSRPAQPERAADPPARWLHQSSLV